MTRKELLSSERFNIPCDERDRLQLSFSKNMVDWCFAGLVAKGDSEKLEAASRFGILCGRAFQITDDLLDIHSTSEDLGKTIGKDVDMQKSTFPSLLGEEGASDYAKKCIKEAKKCLSFFDDSDAKKELKEFCDYILIRKS
jgi:geranylgeranyl diphosphate synthase type II